jgi:hypothetical protein
MHAPLGHWAPLAASALFAAAGLSHSTFLRILAYSLATILALLIAADLARSLLETEPASASRDARPAKHAQVTVLQLVITAVLASIYTYFIFVGLGPWTPFMFVPPIYLLSCLAAWRNVRLWYRQGAEYEIELKQAEEIERLRLAHAHWRDNER